MCDGHRSPLPWIRWCDLENPVPKLGLPMSRHSMIAVLSDITAELRPVLKCFHCDLVQFETKSKMCRRCKRPYCTEPEPIEATEPAPVPTTPSLKALDIGHAVAIYVKLLRQAHGYSQRGMALALGVPRTYIS